MPTIDKDADADTDEYHDIDNSSMLDIIRSFVGIGLRNEGAIATSDVLQIAQAFNALDCRLRIGEELPKAWHRATKGEK